MICIVQITHINARHYVFAHFLLIGSLHRHFVLLSSDCSLRTVDWTFNHMKMCSTSNGAADIRVNVPRNEPWRWLMICISYIEVQYTIAG